MNCWERWKDTGSSYNTLFGSFDTSKGDLRLVNVTAGYGGKSYIDWRKVKAKLEDFCEKYKYGKTRA